MRPEGAEPPAAPIDTEAGPRAPRRARETTRSRAAARRRRSRRRNYLIGAAVILLLIAAIVVPRVLSTRRTASFEQLASGAGCGKVENTSTSGAGKHLREGETTKYDTSPPTHGEHANATMPAAVYDEPLSDQPLEAANIFKAVHSLEHGAVIVWHDKLSTDDQRELEREYRNAEKVLIVPYPDLKGDDHVVLTAWGRMVKCEEASTRVVDGFIDLFRDARTAPEPGRAI